MLARTEKGAIGIYIIDTIANAFQKFINGYDPAIQVRDQYLYLRIAQV